ncbi:hypothetical protein [uncultured Algoriphagus sp.]|uniref:hypothetical protein n=1 Tax=uncultured Algoriphagus sp. TaxID=417365 RepID=UPI002582C4FD|nr:hypothetical protein [uncultured Algoriphagus sp.]
MELTIQPQYSSLEWLNNQLDPVINLHHELIQCFIEFLLHKVTLTKIARIYPVIPKMNMKNYFDSHPPEKLDIEKFKDHFKNSNLSDEDVRDLLTLLTLMANSHIDFLIEKSLKKQK